MRHDSTIPHSDFELAGHALFAWIDANRGRSGVSAALRGLRRWSEKAKESADAAERRAGALIVEALEAEPPEHLPTLTVALMLTTHAPPDDAFRVRLGRGLATDLGLTVADGAALLIGRELAKRFAPLFQRVLEAGLRRSMGPTTEPAAKPSFMRNGGGPVKAARRVRLAPVADIRTDAGFAECARIAALIVRRSRKGGA